MIQNGYKHECSIHEIEYRIQDRVDFLLRTLLIAKLYLTVYFKHISPNSNHAWFYLYEL